MNIKWKIPIIIAAIIITLGVTVKFAVDKLFSYVLFSSLSGSQISLNSLDSLISDLDTTRILPDSLEENQNSNEDSGLDSNNSDNTETEGSSNSTGNSGKKNTADIVEAINKHGKNNDNLNGDNNDSEGESVKDKPDLTDTKSNLDISSEKGTIKENKDSNDTGKDNAAEDYTYDNNKVNDNSEKNNHAGNIAEGNSTENENSAGSNTEKSNTENKNSESNGNENNNTADDKQEDVKKGSDTDNETDNGSMKVTSDKIKEVEKKVSTTDKLKAVNILLSKLKPSDIQTLMNMALGGDVTDEEINKAKQIIKERVTPEEKEILKSLFYKYEYLLDE